MFQEYGGEQGWPFIEEASYKLVIDVILEEQESQQIANLKKTQPKLFDCSSSSMVIFTHFYWMCFYCLLMAYLQLPIMRYDVFVSLSLFVYVCMLDFGLLHLLEWDRWAVFSIVVKFFCIYCNLDSISMNCNKQSSVII